MPKLGVLEAHFQANEGDRTVKKSRVHVLILPPKVPADMTENQKDRAEEVYSRVNALMQGQDLRELWFKIRSELSRRGGGPDACLAYLESELARMEEQVRRGLDALRKT